jgi:hypothetical protein
MALDTYTGLQTSIGNWLNRADLASIIPDFISVAEAQITRRLIADGPVREMMGRSDATINAEFIPVPSDFYGVRAIYLTGSLIALEMASPEEIDRRKILYPSASGDPQIYAVVGGEIQFWPWVSGGSYAGELTYWKRIPPLSVANASNWLLASHPDIYLYVSLLQSAPYLQNDDRVATWGTIATQLLDDMVRANRVAMSAPYLSVPIVSGGTP